MYILLCWWCYDVWKWWRRINRWLYDNCGMSRNDGAAVTSLCSPWRLCITSLHALPGSLRSCEQVTISHLLCPVSLSLYQKSHTAEVETATDVLCISFPTQPSIVGFVQYAKWQQLPLSPTQTTKKSTTTEASAILTHCRPLQQR
jgi:hypothetical protein